MSTRDSTPVQWCATCGLYSDKAVRDKAGRLRNDRATQCGWKSTEPWPISVPGYVTRPQPNYMRPRDGVGCKVWTPKP